MLQDEILQKNNNKPHAQNEDSKEKNAITFLRN